MGVDLNTLGINIGAGNSMFFQYVKWCSCMVLAIFASEGALNLYENFYSENPFCGVKDSTCADLTATKTSTVNKLNNLKEVY